jgi:hypothetical protein
MRFGRLNLICKFIINVIYTTDKQCEIFHSLVLSSHGFNFILLGFLPLHFSLLTPINFSLLFPFIFFNYILPMFSLVTRLLSWSRDFPHVRGDLQCRHLWIKFRGNKDFYL